MSKKSDHRIVNSYKRSGETPLECLDRVRNYFDISKSIPMTYAGRLDPLAEGVLVLLVGEETKNKDQYLQLNKVYEFEVLFDFATDTYDLLGLVQEVHAMSIDQPELERILQRYIGTKTYQYPPYSSKTVHGKPLFQYAREGLLETITLPTYKATIAALTLDDLYEVRTDELWQKIEASINSVAGDFRQEQILSTWQKTLSMLEMRTHTMANITMHCSSGMYVRRLAHELGKNLGGSALAYSIKRTQVGDYSIVDSVRINS